MPLKQIDDPGRERVVRSHYDQVRPFLLPTLNRRPLRFRKLDRFHTVSTPKIILCLVRLFLFADFYR